jgi:hypothetical protein
LYRVVSHPIMLGFLIAFWATPAMTWDHLLFAGMTTAYIAVGVWLEERDLHRAFGDTDDQYRRRVGMLFPRFESGSQGSRPNPSASRVSRSQLSAEQGKRPRVSPVGRRIFALISAVGLAPRTTALVSRAPVMYTSEVSPSTVPGPKPSESARTRRSSVRSGQNRPPTTRRRT